MIGAGVTATTTAGVIATGMTGAGVTVMTGVGGNITGMIAMTGAIAIGTTIGARGWIVSEPGGSVRLVSPPGRAGTHVSLSVRQTDLRCFPASELGGPRWLL